MLTRFVLLYLIFSFSVNRNKIRYVEVMQSDFLRSGPSLSHFGNFVEIQFATSGRIFGAAIRNFLLEISRVVQITDPERNYHYFYQLCASGRDAENYKLGHPSDFHYLNQSKTYELHGVSYGEEYTKTRRAMGIVGISQDEHVLQMHPVILSNISVITTNLLHRLMPGGNILYLGRNSTSREHKILSGQKI